MLRIELSRVSTLLNMLNTRDRSVPLTYACYRAHCIDKEWRAEVALEIARDHCFQEQIFFHVSPVYVCEVDESRDQMRDETIIGCDLGPWLGRHLEYRDV